MFNFRFVTLQINEHDDDDDDDWNKNYRVTRNGLRLRSRSELQDSYEHSVVTLNGDVQLSHWDKNAVNQP